MKSINISIHVLFFLLASGPTQADTMSPHAAEHGSRRRLKGCDEKVMSDTFLLAGRSIAHAGSLFLTPPMINASGIVPCLPIPPHPPSGHRITEHSVGAKAVKKRKKKAHECTCIIICGVCACVCTREIFKASTCIAICKASETSNSSPVSR